LLRSAERASRQLICEASNALGFWGAAFAPQIVCQDISVLSLCGT
jgi:hypothetical protein